MKNLYCILFLYIALSLNINAQNIVVNAKVLDSETNEALPNATVCIDGTRNCIANIEGEFSIESSPEDELKVSYIGYKTIKIKAGKVGSTIKLTPYSIELSEVKVLPLKSILTKIVSVLKSEIPIYKEQESNFYYRQTTQNKGECCEYIETFLNGYSEVALRQPSIITGRYGELQDTENKKYSRVGNYYGGSCISPYAPQKISKKIIIMPIMLDSEKMYQTNYDILCDKTSGNMLYRITFTPRTKVKAPIVKGIIYVDADTYKIQKYEGEELNNHIIDRNGERYAFTRSFSVSYTYQRGFMEVQSVTTKGKYMHHGTPVNINSTLVNVGKKYYKGKKKLGDFANLKNKISSVNYDAKFWNDNSIIKRTPMEEKVVKMFEKENIFSNINE